MGAIMEQRLPTIPDNHILLVNKNHPLIIAILKLKSGSVIVGSSGESSSDTLTRNLGKYLYDMARLGVGGIEPKEIAVLQARSSEIIKQLIERTL